VPYVGCGGPKYNATDAGRGSSDAGGTVLTEVWYYFHVYGKPQRDQGVPVPADINGGRTSSCAKAKGSVWYYERSKGSEV
jgi:ribonuclease T2